MRIAVTAAAAVFQRASHTPGIVLSVLHISTHFNLQPN